MRSQADMLFWHKCWCCDGLNSPQRIPKHTPADQQSKTKQIRRSCWQGQQYCRPRWGWSGRLHRSRGPRSKLLAKKECRCASMSTNDFVTLTSWGTSEHLQNDEGRTAQTNDESRPTKDWDGLGSVAKNKRAWARCRGWTQSSAKGRWCSSHWTGTQLKCCESRPSTRALRKRNALPCWMNKNCCGTKLKDALE